MPRGSEAIARLRDTHIPKPRMGLLETKMRRLGHHAERYHDGLPQKEL